MMTMCILNYEVNFLIYAYNTIERCLFKKGSQKKR